MPKREKNQPIRRPAARRAAEEAGKGSEDCTAKEAGFDPVEILDPSTSDEARLPLSSAPERWIATFRTLFEWFAIEMLRSEEQRALAIFEIDPDGNAPFAQYQMEPCGILLDLPTSSVDGEARERLLAAGVGLRRAAEVPELRPSDEDVRACDPLRKEYRWSGEERASRELAWLLFDFFGAPRAGPIFLAWWAEGGISRQRIVLCHGDPTELPVH